MEDRIRSDGREEPPSWRLSRPHYPTTVCDMDGSGRVMHGDCLDVLQAWDAGPIDLVYADPPFNTGLVRSAKEGSFSDSFDDYLGWIRPRIEACIANLAGTGAILLHCDWRTVHHLRLMLDDLLGADRFVNELVWSYGLGGSSPRRFARKHDSILYYELGDARWFEPPMIPATSNRMKGGMKKATDVLDIPAINNMAHERLGYPTQKPLALLRLLVTACCPPDGLVVDPFCGSGTTLEAAEQEGRRWIGIDRNDEAVHLSRARLHRSAVRSS